MNSPRTTPGQNDDWLDHLLRQDARAHVDDAGFADGVMAALPSRRRPMRIFTWRLLPGVMTLLAAWLAIGVLPGSDVFLDGVADIMASELTSPRAVAMLGTLAVFVGLAVSVATSER